MVQDFAEALMGAEARSVVIGVSEDDEAQEIAACRAWVVERGLVEGIESYELVDEETGEALAILDLAWPEGMQLELTEPVALFLNEPPEVGRTPAERGFRFFTTGEALKTYVRDELLEAEVA